MFTLNPKLKEDCFFVTDLKLSQLLLMNDSNYFWFILVPKKDGLVELTDLAFDEQIELLKEINEVSDILKNHGKISNPNLAPFPSGNVLSAGFSLGERTVEKYIENPIAEDLLREKFVKGTIIQTVMRRGKIEFNSREDQAKATDIKEIQMPTKPSTTEQS